MKRRSFIAVSILSLLGAGAFSLIRWLHNSDKVIALAQPRFLSQLCDRSTIQMLGRAYLKLKPEEKGDDILLSDLLARKSRKGFLEGQDISKAESQIEKRIKQDFDTDNVVMVQGWLLSITEARQCAFYSMINN